MPPRAGQLDEISQAIGRLEGAVKAIDQYTHEREHGLNNLSQKIDGLKSSIAKDIAAVEGRIEGRIKAMDDRLVSLELAAQREAGAKNLAIAFLNSPVIAWLFAIAVAAWTYFKGAAR